MTIEHISGRVLRAEPKNEIYTLLGKDLTKNAHVDKRIGDEETLGVQINTLVWVSFFILLSSHFQLHLNCFGYRETVMEFQFKPVGLMIQVASVAMSVPS